MSGVVNIVAGKLQGGERQDDKLYLYYWMSSPIIGQFGTTDNCPGTLKDCLPQLGPREVIFWVAPLMIYCVLANSSFVVKFPVEKKDFINRGREGGATVL